MHPKRLQQHTCPVCRSGRLELHVDGGGAPSDDVGSGTVSCPSCGGRWPIVRGLPRFVPAANYADSFGYQWNLHARTQLDSHTGLPISRDRLLAAIGTGAEALSGLRVLEAGSGAGRFTEVLLRAGADVVSFDYSSAVDANARNHLPSPHLHLFQGDIFSIPLIEQSFDLVICLGVLQHTPDPQAAFRSLARQVRPGGRLVVDVYRRSPTGILHWKYLLRPLTRRLRKEALYRAIERATPPLVPLTRWLRRAAGPAGARLSPILEYSHLGLSDADNVQWAILDTFDMYSPAHDHPQSVATLQHWFDDIGFTDVHVRPGPNGVVGSGRRPSAS